MEEIAAAAHQHPAWVVAWQMLCWLGRMLCKRKKRMTTTGSRHNEFMLHEVTKESKKNFDETISMG
jgi:hypothetical protein